MGNIKLIGVCILAASFTGCGGKKGGGAAGGGYDSPEAVAKALIGVAGDGEHAADGLFPPDDKLKAAVTCTGTETLLDKVAKSKADVQRQLGKSKGVKFEFVGGEAGDIKKLAKGETEDGCTANEVLEVGRYKVKFKITQGDKTEEENEGIHVIKFESGGWYLVDM